MSLNCAVVSNRYSELLRDYVTTLLVSGECSGESMKAHLEKVIKSGPAVLIFDITSLKESALTGYVNFFQWLRAVFPDTQIIVFAPDMKESVLCKELVQAGIYDFIFNVPYDVKARRDADLKNRIYWAVQNPKAYGDVQSYVVYDNALEGDTPKSNPLTGLFGSKKKSHVESTVPVGISSAPVLDSPKNGRIITIASFGSSNAIAIGKHIAEQAAACQKTALLLVLDPVFSPATQCNFSVEELNACDGWVRYAMTGIADENALTSKHWREFPALCFKSPSMTYYASIPGTNGGVSENMLFSTKNDLTAKYDAVLTAAKENFDVVVSVSSYGTLPFRVSDARSEDSYLVVQPHETFSRFFGDKNSYLLSYIVDGGSKKETKRLYDAFSAGGATYEGSIVTIPAGSGKYKDYAPILANVL